MRSIKYLLVKYRSTIGYAILMALVAVSLMISYQVQQAQLLTECEASNQTRLVLDQTLQILAAPRDDDEEGDFERRMDLYEQLEHLIALRDCDKKFG